MADNTKGTFTCTTFLTSIVVVSLKFLSCIYSPVEI